MLSQKVHGRRCVPLGHRVRDHHRPGRHRLLVNTASVAPDTHTTFDDDGSNNSASDTDTILPPDIFADGFESGDTSAWSQTAL